MPTSSQDEAAQTRHDLRNALASALLCAEMLESHQDPTVQDHATTIIHSIERALTILRPPT
nr:histidine kinase dimerization/phospho-acceptor domain-containing protein [uncultured Neokomagataea sp.]